MIEWQRRYPEFPGQEWQELKHWQQLSLKDIKRVRFRFHGKLVETRRHLNAYIEQEIIHARLRGLHVNERMLNGQYKK